MIMTFGTAMILLLSGCAAVLALGVIDTAVRIFRGWRTADEEKRYDLEKSFYLTYSVVCIVLGIRLFIVPVYFWNLQSLVPMIPGAMCLWGVFNALPTLMWPNLFLKFLLPTIYMGWLILAKINSDCKTNPLMVSLTGFYVAVSPLLLLDSTVDILTSLNLSPVEVSCCSSAIDVGPRPIPIIIGGVDGQIFLTAIFFTVSVALAISAFLCMKYDRVEWISRIFASAYIPVLILTMTEVLTPWILHLPLHHCPFCLLFQAPSTVIFLALSWFAISSPWITLLTEKLGRADEESKVIEKKTRMSLWLTSGFAATIATSIIVVHLALAFI